jgi:hypothetical protein
MRQLTILLLVQWLLISLIHPQTSLLLHQIPLPKVVLHRQLQLVLPTKRHPLLTSKLSIPDLQMTVQQLKEHQYLTLPQLLILSPWKLAHQNWFQQL